MATDGVSPVSLVAALVNRLTDPSRPYGGLILALIGTFWAWAPLIDPSLSMWKTLDAPNHMVRTHLLAVMASHGEWFPRWFPQQFGGYGYPTLNFYAPLTYYVTAVLATLFPGGSAIETAYVTVLVVASVTVVTGTYALGWVLWRHGPAALLMAVSVAYGAVRVADQPVRRGRWAACAWIGPDGLAAGRSA